MAFVINPDGTINTLEVNFDRSGNIIPKRIINEYKNSSSQQPKKKKKKQMTETMSSISSLKPKDDIDDTNKQKIQKSITKGVAETKLETITVSKNITNSPYNTYKVPEKKKLFQTKEAIDDYFIKRKELHQILHKEILVYAIKNLKPDLSAYFVKCFNEHNEYCRSQGWYIEDSLVTKRKTRMESAISPTKNTPSSKFGKSRHPVYGYARDRYGRVLEKDSHNEDRKNEFRQSQTLQARYDYSSFDSENDHDCYYDSNSYD